MMEPEAFQAHINWPKDSQCNQGKASTARNEEEESEETNTRLNEESDEEMVD